MCGWESKTHAEIKRIVVSQRRRFKLAPSPPRHTANSTTKCLVPCVTSGREKEGRGQRHSWDHAESLLHYPLEIAQCWRILLLANLFLFWGTRSFIIAPSVWNNRFPTFPLNVIKKLSNHKAQQAKRAGSSTITQRKPQVTLFLLLRIYLFLIGLYSFILFCWCMIGFLRKNLTKILFIIFWHQSSWIQNNITQKIKMKMRISPNIKHYKNSKNVVIFHGRVVVLWYMCRASRERLPSCIASVHFCRIYLCVLKHSHPVQAGLRRKWFC